MEQFAFQQLPKNKQRRCTLRRWRQTVPDARTGDTECTVTYGGLLRPQDVQSGRGRGSQPSAWLQGCQRLQLVSKVLRSSTMKTMENEHCKFELNVLKVQTTSAVPWAVALCARTSVWSRSAEQRRAEQTEVAPSTVHSDQPVLHCHSQDVSRQATAQATATKI